MNKQKIAVMLGLIFLAGCSSAIKHQPTLQQVRKLLVLPPWVELEMFPGGEGFQTPPEHRAMQQALTGAIQEQLKGSIMVEVAPGAPDLPENIGKMLRKVFVQLQTADRLEAVTLSEPLRTSLVDRYGTTDILVVYYSGFRRSPESMAHGYHSTAFQNELVPRAFGREREQLDRINTVSEGLAQNSNISLPEKYGATLKLAVFRGSKKSPVFYNTGHYPDDPAQVKTAVALARNVAGAMEKLLKTH